VAATLPAALVQPVGQLTLSGLGAASVTVVTTAVGQITLSGLASPQTTAIHIPTGRLTLSGLAGAAVSVVVSATGQLTVSGVADLTVTAVIQPAGRLTVSGVADLSVGQVFSGLGGFAFSGVASVNSQATVQPAGGVSLSGDASVTVAYVALPGGQIALSGSATPTAAVAFSASGQLRLSGYASVVDSSASVYGIAHIGDETAGQSIVLGNLYNSGSITGFGFLSSDGSGQLVGSSGALPTTGQWYSVALRRSDTTVELYVNGVLVNTHSISSSPLYGSDPVVTFAQRLGKFFPGKLDDIRVYGRAVPSWLIATLAAGDDYMNGTVALGYVFSATGALVLSGSADTYTTAQVEPTGQLTLSGLASITVTVTTSATGNLTLTGLSGVQFGPVVVGGGAITLSGLASATTTATVEPTGGLTLTGTGTVMGAVSVDAGGSLVFDGISRVGYDVSIEGSGAILVSGAATLATGLVWEGTGGLSLTAGQDTAAFQYEPSGTLVLSGSVPFQRSYVVAGRGKVMVFDPTLVAWWRLEEGAGDLAGDSSAYERTAALFNTDPGNWVAGTPFLSNNLSGLHLDGVDEYMEAEAMDLNGMQDFTLSLWARPDSLPGPAVMPMMDDLEAFLAESLDDLPADEEEGDFTLSLRVQREGDSAVAG
jgi:hypothetical protein